MSKRRHDGKVGNGIQVFQDAFEACFDPVTAAKLRMRAEYDRELRSKYKLKEVLDCITPENCHPETDWGPAVGKEISDDGPA